MEKKYKVVIYPELIVLSEIGKEEDLDLCIDNPLLTEKQEVILNLLEAIIYKQKNKHLFGIKSLKPLVNYNPNTMNEKQYDSTVKKALKFLGVI